jgi:hypothetical protein
MESLPNTNISLNMLHLKRTKTQTITIKYNSYKKKLVLTSSKLADNPINYLLNLYQ